MTSPVTNPKTGSRDAVDTDGHQLMVANVSWAKTSHKDPRPLNEPTALTHLEAVCMPAEYLKTGTEHLPTIAGRRIIQVAREGVEGSPNIDMEGHSMMNVRADQQARLAAIREQRASIAAQPQVLWLSTAGAETSAPAETGLVPAQMQLLPTEADLLPAEADQGSAEEQLVPAEADLVPAEADLVHAEADQGFAEEQLVPAEADLMPAEEDQWSAEEQLVPAETNLVPAETPLVSAKVRPADTAPSALTEDPGPVLPSEREAGATAVCAGATRPMESVEALTSPWSRAGTHAAAGEELREPQGAAPSPPRRCATWLARAV
jgi:hypothetical protein